MSYIKSLFIDQLKSNNPNIEHIELNTIDVSIRPK